MLDICEVYVSHMYVFVATNVTIGLSHFAATSLVSYAADVGADDDFDDDEDEEAVDVDDDTAGDGTANDSVHEPSMDEAVDDDEIVPDSEQHPPSHSVRSSSTKKSTRESVSSVSTPAQTTPIKKYSDTRLQTMGQPVLCTVCIDAIRVVLSVTLLLCEVV